MYLSAVPFGGRGDIRHCVRGRLGVENTYSIDGVSERRQLKELFLPGDGRLVDRTETARLGQAVCLAQDSPEDLAAFCRIARPAERDAAVLFRVT